MSNPWADHIFVGGGAQPMCRCAQWRPNFPCCRTRAPGPEAGPVAVASIGGQVVLVDASGAVQVIEEGAS